METVNDADALLALWDGQAARGKGGTADVVDYARSLGKPVIIIDAATLEIRRENFAALARDDANLAFLNGLPAGRHKRLGELRSALPIRFSPSSKRPTLRPVTACRGSACSSSRPCCSTSSQR